MWKNGRREGAMAGGMVGMAVVGVLALLRALRLASFVPLDIANTIIEFTPGAVATQTIETLGKWGMRSLIIGSVLGFVLAYAALGMLLAAWLRRRTGVGSAVAAGLAGAIAPLGLSLAMQRLVAANAASAPRGPIAPLILALVFGLAGVGLALMARGLLQRSDPDPAVRSSRRRFLLGSAGAALGLAAGSGALAAFWPKRTIEAAGATLPTSVPALPPTAAPSATAAPTMTAPPGAPTPTPAPPTATPLPAFIAAPGTRPEITEQDSLYLISSSTRDPEIDPSGWRLKIGGAVDAPFELTYDELLALPRQDQTSTLECISNEVGNLLIGTCNWNGVRLSDLLNKAGVQAGVVDIVFRAAEGYSESLPLADALDPDTLVAYGIDGMALQVKHGFPARLRIANKYGEKNVKWLTEIEAVREDYQGYWQQRGWDDDATIFTTSVADTGNPRLGSTQLKLADGGVALGGIAFAGARGIRRVEIQIDGGDWREARLKEAPSDLAWRLWRYDWREATPGKHTLTVRAVDGAGAAQVADVRDTHPSGATGYHTIDIEVA